MILARELAVVLDNLPESVELLACKFEFGDRPPVTVHIGDNADKIRTRIDRQAVESNRLYPPYDIMRVICDRFKVTQKAIKGEGRYKTVVMARQVLCYLMRRHTSLTLKEIALFVYGHTDHTTALYHVRRVSGLLHVNDTQTKEHVTYIENKLSTSHPPLPTQ